MGRGRGRGGGSGGGAEREGVGRRGRCLGGRGGLECVGLRLAGLFLLRCLMLSGVLRVRVWVFAALALRWAAAYLCFI